jgi:periplasmic divalent cation tolerance protein
MAFILVYVTHKTADDARKMIAHLMGRRLIACANVFPIESTYRWKGKVEECMETVSLLKARKGNWTKLKKEIESMHPYEVPCIMRLQASANKSFEKWIDGESGPKRG